MVGKYGKRDNLHKKKRLHEQKGPRNNSVLNMFTVATSDSQKPHWQEKRPLSVGLAIHILQSVSLMKAKRNMTGLNVAVPSGLGPVY